MAADESDAESERTSELLSQAPAAPAAPQGRVLVSEQQLRALRGVPGSATANRAWNTMAAKRVARATRRSGASSLNLKTWLEVATAVDTALGHAVGDKAG